MRTDVAPDGTVSVAAVPLVRVTVWGVKLFFTDPIIACMTPVM